MDFSCVTWQKLSFDKLYYFDGQDYEEIKLYPNNRSKTYEIKKGALTLELFREVQTVKGTTYQAVGRAPLIQNAKQMLFFIAETKGQNDRASLRVQGIDDSLDAFPVGHFRFVNMSGKELGVSFAGEVIRLPKRSMKVAPSRVDKDGGLVPFIVADREGNKVYETRLFAQTRGRDMVFILPQQEGRKLVEVKFLPQIIPPQSGA